MEIRLEISLLATALELLDTYNFMALGSFANLRPYQVAAAQPNQNPLDALIQGIQQGTAIQQLPQTLQQDALNKQLQQEIAMAKLNQLQTGEIQNVGGSLVRINRQTGQPEVIFSPEKPVNSQFVGFDRSKNPIVFNPRDNSLSIIPAPAGSDIAGSLDPKVLPAETLTTVDSDQGLLRTGSRSTEATPLTVGGVQATRTKPTKSTGALTENARLSIFRKASEAGIDPDNPKYFNEETQSTDFTRLAVDTGKSARENKRLEDAAKASGLTGKSKTTLEELNAASRQLDSLNDEVLEIARSGKTPGFLDNMIAAETSYPASGAISAGWQQLLKGIQSEESKVLEDRKAVVASQLNKAVSGLATTLSEDRKTSYLPRPGDTFEDLIRKVSSLREYVDNQRGGLSQGSGGGVAPTSTPSGIQIRSIKRVQ